MKPNIIKNKRVRIEDNPRPVLQGKAGVSVRCQKSVQLLEENGAQAIEVTCSCGEVTVIELKTQGDAGPAQQA